MRRADFVIPRVRHAHVFFIPWPTGTNKIHFNISARVPPTWAARTINFSSFIITPHQHSEVLLARSAVLPLFTDGFSGTKKRDADPFPDPRPLGGCRASGGTRGDGEDGMQRQYACPTPWRIRRKARRMQPLGAMARAGTRPRKIKMAAYGRDHVGLGSPSTDGVRGPPNDAPMAAMRDRHGSTCGD